MEAIEFKEQNVIIAKNQPEYLPLPAHKANDQEGLDCVVSCWKGTLVERIRFLITGKLYLKVFTNHKPLQPLFMAVNKWHILNRKVFNTNL